MEMTVGRVLKQNGVVVVGDAVCRLVDAEGFLGIGKPLLILFRIRLCHRSREKEVGIANRVFLCDLLASLLQLLCQLTCLVCFALIVVCRYHHGSDGKILWRAFLYSGKSFLVAFSLTFSIA